MLRRREVSPLELVEASAERIAATDGHLNAIPTLCIERARAHAERIMAEDTDTERPPGWLGGVPIAVKDLVEVEGVRTTWGSPIYADHVPPRSDIVVETLEARGAIVIGKSNTPEFGAGANTFNEVFGKTRNPWNTDKTCGGSSGGSSTALATGQVWLATGSDLGGSLRIPASFCSVFGMRPSPGRVAHGPKHLPFEGLMVDGPMARNARDCALMLDAMSGASPEDPLSIEAPAQSFADSVSALPPPGRIAYSPDLGLLPVDREVAAVCKGAAETLAGAGMEVAEACPDLSGALDVFQVLRAALFAADKGELLETHRDALKPEVIWNIEKGLALDADKIARAERARGRHLSALRALLRPPRRAGLPLRDRAALRRGHALGRRDRRPPLRQLRRLAGPHLRADADRVSFSASVPVGFTEAGLPVGLQILGPAARRGGGAAGGGRDRGGDSAGGRHAHRPARPRRRHAPARLRGAAPARKACGAFVSLGRGAGAHSDTAPHTVMAGLDPAIHVFRFSEDGGADRWDTVCCGGRMPGYAQGDDL